MKVRNGKISVTPTEKRVAEMRLLELAHEHDLIVKGMSKLSSNERILVVKRVKWMDDNRKW